MVVVPARVVALEGDHLAADVNAVDQLQLLELLQRPVHTCPTDRGQPPVDLQRSQRAALAVQQLDHLPPRGAGCGSLPR